MACDAARRDLNWCWGSRVPRKPPIRSRFLELASHKSEKKHGHAKSTVVQITVVPKKYRLAATMKHEKSPTPPPPPPQKRDRSSSPRRVQVKLKRRATQAPSSLNREVPVLPASRPPGPLKRRAGTSLAGLNHPEPEKPGQIEPPVEVESRLGGVSPCSHQPPSRPPPRASQEKAVQANRK